MVRLKTFEILDELNLTENDLGDLDADTYKRIARIIVKNIADNLPTKVDGRTTTSNSKLPFKIIVLREVLAHRVSELASVALQLYDAAKIIPAFVMTRAVLETVCVMFSLHKHVVVFNNDHDVNKLDAFLTKAIMGSRDDSTTINCESILNSIDRVDKEFKGLRKMYDCLCEFTHPNWSGALGAYGTIDTENCCLLVGNKNSAAKIGLGFAPFVQSLVIFSEYYNDLAELITKINEDFDALPDEIT